MGTMFTEEDIGKTVEDSNGAALGVVASVDDGIAMVEPDPGAIDSIKAALGWESDPDEVFPVEPGSVDVIGGETVRLEGDGADRTEDDVRMADGNENGAKRGGATRDQSQVEGEAGSDRHQDNADAPPEGDRTMTTDRGRKDDR
ncbi:hypothetical protein [Natronobacterium texcoconense]|uniref:PRC-barrel domain-containing protein n=1 Tax=Natronobacterium texcoconense TaxID=1095778 RepID=A0A1H1C2H3_NATTX|nr:hypothetical protein [Natronobacterium texcoconense]SDQ58341.1 hypothetical protein SAMN04489842_1242 [Natronobacterium texcoconense]